jgi:hypothetical protein
MGAAARELVDASTGSTASPGVRPRWRAGRRRGDQAVVHTVAQAAAEVGITDTTNA